MEVRIPHELGADEAARRLHELASDHGLAVEAGPDPRSGHVERQTPMGRVRARFVAEEREVVVQVEKKPPFLPERTVRRTLEENLGAALQA